MEHPIEKDLRDILSGEVLADEATLTKYSTDASIFRVRPQAVVCPKDAADLKALVNFVSHKLKANSYKLSLTARAGGSDMSGGPLNDSIIVDFTKHFNRIKHIDEKKAIVEPGVFYRDFEKQAQKLGVMLPPYPASKMICTVGGMVANNSAGEKTLAYGKTADYVTGLKVVLADGNEYAIKPLAKPELRKKLKQKDFEGELYRKLYGLLEKNYAAIQKAKPDVSKNSAGYALWDVWDKKIFDLTRIIAGSQGTLGLVTEITFRLAPMKKYSRLAVVFLKNLKPLADIAREALKFRPESFESYDDHTLKVAMKFLPDLVQTLKGNLLSLAFQFLPEVWMIIKGGFPKLVLLIELTSDDARELDVRLRALKQAMQAFGVPVRVTKSEEEAEKYWTVRRESFNLLRRRVQGKQTVPFIDDVIVRPEKLSEFLPRLNAILEPYSDRMIYTIAGHVGNGNFHIIPLMDLSEPESQKLIKEISEKVYPLVLEFGGSITAEHNDGLIRTPYLEMMYGKKVYKFFEQAKEIFDPKGIFNPRKKVGESSVYAFRHLASGA